MYGEPEFVDLTFNDIVRVPYAYHRRYIRGDKTDGYQKDWDQLWPLLSKPVRKYIIDPCGRFCDRHHRIIFPLYCMSILVLFTVVCRYL